MEKKRTIEELNKELGKYFKQVGRCLEGCKPSYHVSVAYPSNGGIACVHFSKERTDNMVCESVRVMVSSDFNGCFKVAIPTTELPIVETLYLKELYFDNCEDAYEFVVNRAMDINMFFNHSK